MTSYSLLLGGGVLVTSDFVGVTAAAAFATDFAEKADFRFTGIILI